MKRLALFIASLLTALSALSQISVGGMPYSYEGGARPASSGKFLQLGAVDDFFIQLNADTVRHEVESGYRALYVGNVCNVDITPDKYGIKFKRDDNMVWRVGLTSKGAASIGIVFNEFNIPSGARLFIYNPSQTAVLGAFTSENNNSSNVLPVQPLASDSLIVEYIEPVTGERSTIRGRLKIGSASHNFYDIGELRRANPNGGNKCTPHVNQAAYDNPFKDASCALFVAGRVGRAWYGSGQLINNADKQPYVISAAHLFDTTEDMKQTVFYFQYQTPKQDTLVVGSMELTIAGATSLAYDQSIDMALMRLNQTPPKDYRPYLAGWDISESQYGPLKCIQHPYGDFAKISFSNNNPVKSYITFDRDKFIYESFWKVARWYKGTTQAGSSGSALLNPENRIIGTLTGGSSTCTSPINDYFSQISVQFSLFEEPDKSLKSWLDPHGTGITSMDGEYLYPDDNGCERTSNIVEGDLLGFNSLTGTLSGYQSGSNSLGYTEYAEKFEFDDDMTIGGVYVLTARGKYNSSSPVYLNIYTKNDGGYTLASQTIVKPTDYSYSYSGELKGSIFTNWNKREIYVRLAEPVDVGSECMVAVQKESFTNSDSIAIYQTVNRIGAEGNTAFFKSSGSWVPFTQYPQQAMSAALWIEPVVSLTHPSAVDENSDNGNSLTFSVYPNPTDRDVRISAKGSDTDALKFQITDISGRLVKEGVLEFDEGVATIRMPDVSGFYMLNLTHNGHTETHKVIKR